MARHSDAAWRARRQQQQASDGTNSTVGGHSERGQVEVIDVDDESEEFDESVVPWAKCQHCKKRRRVRRARDGSLPDESTPWQCQDNHDSDLLYYVKPTTLHEGDVWSTTCDAPEDDEGDSRHERVAACLEGH